MSATSRPLKARLPDSSRPEWSNVPGDDPVALPDSADHFAVLDAVTSAAVAGIEGGSAVFLLARPMAGRFAVVATSGNAPLHSDEIVTLEQDAMVRDGAAETIPLCRPGQIAPRPAKKAAGANALAVPVTLCGRCLGEIVVFGADAKGRAADGLITRLQELALRAAPAAALARVDSFDAHLTELNAVVEVGQVLTGLLNMEDVLSYVVYLAESLVGGHCASVALLNEDGSEIIFGNSTGNLRGYEGRSLPTDAGVIGWVVREGQPAVVTNLPKDKRGFRLGDELGPGIVVPITSVGRVIGAFLVARLAGSRPFPSEAAAMLQQMAAYAAIAITNAQTHHQQQQIAETLRIQAQQLETAYGELNRSQEQLLISEKMAALGRVTAGIAHEINSPLGGVMNSVTAAKGFVAEYQASIDDPDITGDDHRAIAEDILNALGTAEGAIAKVAQFVKSIKSQTRAGEGGSTTFDPAAEVDATVVLLQHELKRRRVAVFTEMERGNRLTGDQGKFGVLMQNLLSNAVDAYNGEPGEIWVRLRAEDEKLVVSVEDKGSGIPEEIRSRIFDYLFTTKDVGKGTGLGLAMVHSVVTTNFRGDISLSSEVGVGTTFTITIPLNQEANHGA